MTTTTEPTTEGDALWASIGEMPECQLRRGVAADWFEERSGTVECPNCAPPRAFPPYAWKCPTCKGEQYIPDRNGRLAAALRATADRVPRLIGHEFDERLTEDWWWNAIVHTISFNESSKLTVAVFHHLTGMVPDSPIQAPIWRYYPTAAAAIRDLCEAYIKVTYGEVGE